ncbi:MAG: hypothetical protein ABI665_13930 [Vicinamibacterales bacterium]
MGSRIITVLALGAALTMPIVMTGQASDPLRTVAERYVKLVLAVGQHDADYVDAFYGPPEWRTQAEAAKTPLATIEQQAAALVADFAKTPNAAPVPADAELWALRRQYLARQVAALRARVAMLQGRKMSFDEESRALYDAVAPTHTEADFEVVLKQLDARLPGDGTLIERYDRFKQAFVIPPARVDRVFKAAIQACRTRTIAHVELPPQEKFTVEYVTNKSWSGYNWYQGNYKSLIQVNTDLPIYIDRAIDLACHEGYPGHHVYNVLLEKHLVKDRGWVEYTVYPLFSPQSLIAEGTANYGIEVAFSLADRIGYEKDVLFPLAGLDPKRAQEYYEVLALVDRLSYAGNDAARRDLNGAIDRAGAAAWLEKYAMFTRPRAEQRVQFIDQYRSYVINYNLGKDLIRDYIVKKIGKDGSEGMRWREFAALLSSPRLPSGLK